MKKPTKRKAFNFLRSYFDVLNELPDDKDKLHFLLAIINKQFLDEEPKGLSFIVNLSYESQRHSIETSVNGYKTKMKTDLLGNPIKDPTEGGSQGGYEGGTEDPYQQEEEKEKEEEKLYISEILNISYDEYVNDNPDADEKHYWICKNLYSRIKENFADKEIKIMEELSIPDALYEIDKLYRLDKINNGTMAKILLAIKYNIFYANNILSINSLRKKSKGSDLKKYQHLILSYDKSSNENMKNYYSKLVNHLNNYDNTRS